LAVNEVESTGSPEVKKIATVEIFLAFQEQQLFSTINTVFVCSTCKEDAINFGDELSDFNPYGVDGILLGYWATGLQPLRGSFHLSQPWQGQMEFQFV
jgi:hypothetical protein